MFSRQLNNTQTLDTSCRQLALENNRFDDLKKKTMANNNKFKKNYNDKIVKKNTEISIRNNIQQDELVSKIQ